MGTGLLFLLAAALALAVSGCGGKNPETYPERADLSTGQRAGRIGLLFLAGGVIPGAIEMYTQSKEAAYPEIREIRSKEQAAGCRLIEPFQIESWEFPFDAEPYLRPVFTWSELRRRASELGGNTALMVSEWTEAGIKRRKVRGADIAGSRNAGPEAEPPDDDVYVSIVQGEAYKCPKVPDKAAGGPK